MLTMSSCQCVADQRRIGLSGLAFGAALAIAAVTSALPWHIATPPPPARPHNPVVELQASGASLTALRDGAEVLRALLLDLPGVGEVRLRGLLTTGLDVDYAPARLARLGITPDALGESLPAQAYSPPGRIALRLDAAQDGPQSIADRIVRAGGTAFRLGDIATVARVAIDPVCVLIRDGHPAVDIEVVPAKGVAPGSLDAPIKARVGGMTMAGLTLK